MHPDEFLQSTLAAVSKYGEELRESDERGREAERSKARVQTLWLSWVINGHRRYRAKYEIAFANHLRDAVLRHLSADAGDHRARMLSFTDRGATYAGMHAELVDPKGKQTASVAIAVKTSWTEDLEAGLDEFITRDLTRLGSSHGIYLIGFFECEDWDKQDGRCAKSRALDRDGVLESLSARARQRAPEGTEVRVAAVNVALTPENQR